MRDQGGFFFKKKKAQYSYWGPNRTMASHLNLAGFKGEVS